MGQHEVHQIVDPLQQVCYKAIKSHLTYLLFPLYWQKVDRNWGKTGEVIGTVAV